MQLRIEPLLVCVALSAPALGEALGGIWLGGYGDPISVQPDPVRVITWNIERGHRFDQVAAFLGSQRADLLLLQEVDVNARRSGNRRVHEELAEHLGMQYAFAPEFEELGQRIAPNRAYHGQALLATGRIVSAHAIRFKDQSDFWRPRWYLPNWSLLQRRVGGRVALAAEVSFASATAVFLNVHLESRGPESLRLDQMNEILRDAAAYPGDRPVILAGDLNVNGASSPVIRAIESAGFRRAAGAEVTTIRGAARDWIFVRGACRFADPKVHRDVSAADHYPVSVKISLPRPAASVPGHVAGTTALAARQKSRR